MTATEKARRSDALYYETVSVTRRVLCDAIANREADLEDARAENANLRELVRDLREHIESDDGFGPDIGWMLDRMHELGVEVDA